MNAKRGFAKEIVAAIRDGKILGIRARTKPHRVIGIRVVVVEGRELVRFSTTARGLISQDSRFHQLIVNQLIRIRFDSQVAPEGTVQ